MHILIIAVLATGHGGGLDSNGGHYNRRTGEYHTHRSPSIRVTRPDPTPSTVTKPDRDTSISNLSSGAANRPPRTKARTAARTSVPIVARLSPPEPPQLTEPRFTAMMVYGKEKPLADFKIVEEDYLLIWPSGGTGKYPKAMIQYIEARATGEIVAGKKPGSIP